MKIFLTGGTGFIGKRLLHHLLERMDGGDTLYFLARRDPGALPANVTVLQGDLEGIESFRRELGECEYVFHLAGNATFGDGDVYERVNTLPTKRMVDIAKDGGTLKNFVFTSTIGAYDRHPSDRCDEPLGAQSTPNPRSDYGRSKLECERYIRASGIPATIVRPTWVYGPGMRPKSHINVFIDMVCKGALPSRFNFPGRVSLIHVDDLAFALANCLGNDAAVGKAYFAETEDRSIGEIFAVLRHKVHGAAAKGLFMPRFKGLVGALHGKLPVAVGNLFLDYLRARDEAFRTSLLGRAPTTFEAGVDEVVRENATVNGCWIVTGGNSGIGLALARQVRERGRRVVVVDKCVDNLEDFDREDVVEADLSTYEGVEKAAGALAGLRIYCLCNNAGIGCRKKFMDMDVAEIRTILGVNAAAPLMLTRLLRDDLRRSGGVVVNVASSIAYNPLPYMSTYSCTKALVSNWSESISYELRGENHVLTFSPSGTNTNFQGSAGVKNDDAHKLLTPDRVAKKIRRAVETGKGTVILGLATNVLLLVCRALPRRWTITLWGRLMEKLR